MTWYFFRCSCLVYPWNFFFFFSNQCDCHVFPSCHCRCMRRVETLSHIHSLFCCRQLLLFCATCCGYFTSFCAGLHIFIRFFLFFCLSSHYRPWLTLAVPAALSIQVHCAHARDLSHMHKCWPDSLDVSQGQACHRRWHIDQQWPSFCAHGRQHLMINVEHKASSGADTLTACD